VAFGEMRSPARFLMTYSQGMTTEGYFLDCWPGYDRLARMMEAATGPVHLGPILDHGVQLKLRLLASLSRYRRSRSAA